MTDPTENEAEESVARWQWHPQVRETWANEWLYFWRLSFTTYVRGKYVEGIREVMRRTGVLAYVVYELYGGYDMLLRVWLPTTQRVFETTFKDVFNNDPNIVIEGFSVTDIVTHWPWAKADGTMDMLEDEDLEDKLPNKEIKRINEGLELPELAGYEERGFLAPHWHSQGIKFVVLVGASRHAMGTRAAEHTTERLAEILRDADDDAFSEKSLYKGIGFAAYMILGRVHAKRFHSIESDLTQPINKVIAPETFGSRTTTFIMATEDFLDFEEAMRLSVEETHKRTAAEWLSEDEHHHLEVKGSAFSELNAWLGSDDAELVPPPGNVSTENLCKAVAGLLNAEGGAVILGAVEKKRFSGRPQLAGAPEIGEYLICGIKPDPGGENWDHYALKVRDVLASRIKPDPNEFLDIDKDGAGTGLPMCLISVRAPRRAPINARWFYHFPTEEDGTHFWVREGNRTIEKVGPEIDAYKSEKTRRPSEGE
jgi:hypothetical protein